MVYMIATLVGLAILIPVLVGTAYCVSLRLGWIPRAADERPRGSASQPWVMKSEIERNSSASPELITKGKFFFEVLNKPQLDLFDAASRVFIIKPERNAYQLAVSITFVRDLKVQVHAENSETHIVQLPIRELPELNFLNLGGEREVAFG